MTCRIVSGTLRVKVATHGLACQRAVRSAHRFLLLLFCRHPQLHVTNPQERGGSELSHRGGVWRLNEEELGYGTAHFGKTSL